MGVLFFMPWLGLSVGTVTQALSKRLTGFGIRDSFVKEAGATIMPGSSALFLIITAMDEDRIIEVLSRHKASLLYNKLSIDDEIKRRDAFGAKAKG